MLMFQRRKTSGVSPGLAYKTNAKAQLSLQPQQQSSSIKQRTSRHGRKVLAHSSMSQQATNQGLISGCELVVVSAGLFLRLGCCDIEKKIKWTARGKRLRMCI
jgi:hypothetical protein